MNDNTHKQEQVYFGEATEELEQLDFKPEDIQGAILHTTEIPAETSDAMEIIRDCVKFANSRSNLKNLIIQLNSQTFVESIKAMIEKNMESFNKALDLIQAMTSESFKEALEYYRELLENESEKEKFLQYTKLSEEELNELTPGEFQELAENYRVKNKKTEIPEYIETLSIPPLKYIFPNDKISNSLEKLIIDGNTLPLAEEKQDGTAKKEVTSYISFDFDEAAKETDFSEFTLTFSEFDKQVQEAVVSLMKAGNKKITPFMIYKTLTGNSSKQISEKWETDIKTSMRKFNSVYVTADLTETAKLYPDLKQVEVFGRETRLMQFEITYVKSKNGSEVFAYEMLKEPILYTIADAKKQVGTLDIKLLENSKTSNTVDNTELKIYLLKRINSIKHGQSPSILFETLYKAMNRSTAREKRTTRENSEKLLLQFKADKIIKGFEIELKGRQPLKIIIKA